MAADPRLLATVAAALPAAAQMPIHTSAAVGGASQSASDTVSLSPLVEGMEGFGVLRAAALAGVPAVEVRAISNEIGEPDRSRWNLTGALEALEGALPTLVTAVAA
jgi:nucleoside phosphorylase